MSSDEDFDSGRKLWLQRQAANKRYMKKRNLVGRAHEMEAQKKRRKTNNRSAEYRRQTELRHSNQLQSRTFDHLGVIEERQEVENIFYDTKT